MLIAKAKLRDAKGGYQTFAWTKCRLATSALSAAVPAMEPERSMATTWCSGNRRASSRAFSPLPQPASSSQAPAGLAASPGVKTPVNQAMKRAMS